MSSFISSQSSTQKTSQNLISRSERTVGFDQIGEYREDRASQKNPINRQEKANRKVEVALVDSGVGGAMAAALIPGQIKQLASYFCLPIGEKPPAQAEAYTAAMTLWPLIAPLKEADGRDAAQLADHVVIACNSASVRLDPALELIKTLCAKVAENPYAYNFSDEVKSKIVALDGKIKADCDYLKNHIHEIVSATSKAAAAQAFDSLKEDSRKRYDIVIEATNGTTENGSYPRKIAEDVTGRFAKIGYTPVLVEEASACDHDGDNYRFSRNIIEFSNAEREKKTLHIVGRGNPSWVPAIESGTYKDEGVGEELIRKSRSATVNAFQKTKLLPEQPDMVMLCCTHYPALMGSVTKAYPDATIIEQATIVRDMLAGLQKDSVNDNECGSSIVVTVGTENCGGVSRQISAEVACDFEAIDFSSSKTMLEEVVGGIRHASGLNSSAKVTIHQPNPNAQADFELLHRHVGLLHADEIMKEQGYTGKFSHAGDGKLNWSSFESLPNAMQSRWGALLGPRAGHDALERLDENVQQRIDALAQTIVLGEARGVNKIATRVDVGAQLRVATAQIVKLISVNKERKENERGRIGILTGFTVIDNKTGESKGGENDGPPGAVLMAKTFIEQGTPVTLVTDGSAEPTLLTTLELNGLATLKRNAGSKPPGARGVEDYDLDENLLVEVARRPALQREGERYDVHNDGTIVDGVKANLKQQNIDVMISIERPSMTRDGRLFSMVAKDISQHNMNMNSLVEKSDGWSPFTIGIGDGGNEIGTGQAARLVGEMRDPNLELSVARGSKIAASPDYQTDSMILASVSNTGGIALSAAVLTALKTGDADLERLALDYQDTILRMQALGLSIDGVDKNNANTVDGRAMGDFASEERHELGTKEATHADMMHAIIAALK